MTKNFRPQMIKAADIKALYTELRFYMPELPVNSKDFRGFNLQQLNTACQHLKINGFIFDCEVSTDGFNGKPGCLAWRSENVESGLRVNILRYKDHLMYIKNINALFKQWQCGECRHCF